jgi:hypothetical protein
MKLKLMSRIYMFLLLICFSCHTAKNLHGKYELDYPLMTWTLTLNNDGTFIEYIGGHGCGVNYYFGFYKINKGIILLHQINHQLDYLGKHNTVVYDLDKGKNKIQIYVYVNEEWIVDDAKIRLNNEQEFKTINNQGYIEIDQPKRIDSIFIERPSGRPITMSLDTAKAFNKLFIMTYDYSLTSCGDRAYLDSFAIKKNGLHVISQNLNKGSYMAKVKD